MCHSLSAVLKAGLRRLKISLKESLIKGADSAPLSLSEIESI